MEGIILKKIFILVLLLSTLFMFISFKQLEYFWFLYTLTLIIGIILAVLNRQIMNKLPFISSLFIGLLLGLIGYIGFKLCYIYLPEISIVAFNNVQHLLETYSPTYLWQYILLIVVIVAGEELLWRGYIQQMFKYYFPTSVAVLLSSLHFSLALLFCGYYIGALAAFLSSIVFGGIYEKVKSMSLLIIAHLVLVILLFIVLPLF